MIATGSSVPSERAHAATRLPFSSVTVIAVAALAFIQSYARWLDPIIDTGRDLYIPEQLARGAKLYRDIRYQYPPLAPYLLALITGAIGHSLAAYMAIGIAQSAAIAASLWIALRRPLPAFAATLSFVAIVLLRRVDVGRELHLSVQLRRDDRDDAAVHRARGVRARAPRDRDRRAGAGVVVQGRVRGRGAGDRGHSDDRAGGSRAGSWRRIAAR